MNPLIYGLVVLLNNPLGPEIQYTNIRTSDERGNHEVVTLNVQDVGPVTIELDYGDGVAPDTATIVNLPEGWISIPWTMTLFEKDRGTFLLQPYSGS